MSIARAVWLVLLFFTVAVLAGILAGSPERLLAQNPPQGTQTAKPGSINNEDCAVCHEDLAKAFDKNPHTVLEKSPKFNLKNSCESCHGPGEAHASNAGDKTKIISFRGDAKKIYSQQCLTCHKDSHEINGYAGSLHAKSGLACSDCHGVHQAARMTRLLKEPESTLCMSCHLKERTDFSKPYRHRIREGAMGCVDCHQPHNGIEQRQIRQGFDGERKCSKCHLDKTGPFVFEHASLRIRNCQACHEPHGSNNPKMLLRATVRSLCLECHSASRNVLTAQPPSIHDLRSPRYQNCTTCHAKIHGSNYSSLFLR